MAQSWIAQIPATSGFKSELLQTTVLYARRIIHTHPLSLQRKRPSRHPEPPPSQNQSQYILLCRCRRCWYDSYPRSGTPHDALSIPTAEIIPGDSLLSNLVLPTDMSARSADESAALLEQGAVGTGIRGRRGMVCPPHRRPFPADTYRPFALYLQSSHINFRFALGAPKYKY